MPTQGPARCVLSWSFPFSTATMYYRQALQLVPDIESRVSHGEESGRTEEEEEEEGRGESEDSLPGLVQSFCALSLDAVCEPKSPSSVSPGHTVKIFGTNPNPPHTGGAHFSPTSRGPALYSQVGGLCPTGHESPGASCQGEWKITQAVKSFVLWLFCYHLMQVCRGFYLLAREAHLWRMACRK